MTHKKTILDRRHQIIQTADRLFGYFGYEKTTMEDISRETGIPRATIYLTFPGGKEDILIANIEQYLVQVLADMRAIAKRSRVGRLETLKQVILFYILSAYDKSTRNQCGTDNMEKRKQRIHAEMASLFETRNAFFTSLLEQAALTGELPAGHEYERIAEILSHSLTCWLPPTASHFSREALERDANTFFNLMLTGLAKTPTRKNQIPAPIPAL